jgi:hypothetical protein
MNRLWRIETDSGQATYSLALGRPAARSAGNSRPSGSHRDAPDIKSGTVQMPSKIRSGRTYAPGRGSARLGLDGANGSDSKFRKLCCFGSR